MNDFVGANKVRNQFLPILQHLCSLTKDFTVDEYADKEGKTTCVRFQVKTHHGFIDGRVGWDAFDKDVVSFELEWGDECYRNCHTIVRMQNWLTLLIKRGGQPMCGFKTYEELKAYQKCDTVQNLI